VIPTLPRGKKLVMNLKSTWGDEHYVGLSGLEFYSESGHLIPTSLVASIAAKPASVNVLPGVSNDPRVVTNLLDGVNRTCDDLHVWLAPFSQGKRHVVVVNFTREVVLSLLRVWNYNKSRIHAARGAKEVEITFDGVRIFDGVLDKAPGTLEAAPLHAEMIVFTRDPAVLDRLTACIRDQLSTHSSAGAADGKSGLAEHSIPADPTRGSSLSRPHTAYGSPASQVDADANGAPNYLAAQAARDPFCVPAREALAGGGNDTRALKLGEEGFGFDADASYESARAGLMPRDLSHRLALNSTLGGLGAMEGREGEAARSGSLLTDLTASIDLTLARPKTAPRQVPAKLSAGVSAKTAGGPADGVGKPPALTSRVAKEVRLVFSATWGDANFVGLTGLELLSPQLTPIPLTADMLSAHPRDINSVPGHSGDNRTLDKLVDGVNVTVDDNHMWLAPLLAEPQQWLLISLPQPTPLVGFRVWNYNKAFDDSYRGLKWVRVFVDGKLLSPLPAELAGSGSGSWSGSGSLAPSDRFLLRKAPGHALFDFGQLVYLGKPLVPSPNTLLPLPRELATREKGSFTPPGPVLPAGMVLKFLLVDTWGDPHYLGLTSIEVYGHAGQRLPVLASRVAAVPASVNELREGKAKDAGPLDIRTCDKLVDGVNETWDKSHTWLAPFAPGKNMLFVVFDAPVRISMIKVWNLACPVDRGVQHAQISLDDAVIFDGTFRRAPEQAAQGLNRGSFGQAILFCAAEELLKKEKDHVFVDSSEQDVLFTDENQQKKPDFGKGLGSLVLPTTSEPMTTENTNPTYYPSQRPRTSC
jgi:hypothetical protein